ncbi:MAG: protein-L-isoaspartate(D-aspartate) O-methyltransferase [Planctomycetes bacterium]|nr:protein-L-isoaspartate(D-aspartate) O-methyltransferase [Planctomycetota bacterium]
MRRGLLPAALLLSAGGCGEEPGPPAERAVPAVARPAFPVPPPRPGRTAPLPAEEPGEKRAREAMVEDQLRAIGVTDPRVLEAMGTVPRHLFVPPILRSRAYEDTPLPIGHGQTISAPDVVGFMTQALRVKAGDRVLDVGTGSGYQAAVLGELGCRVFSIEILEPLAKEAGARLSDLGYGWVTVRQGDGWLGWPEEAPFDGILVAAAPDRVPPALLAQLKPGARLVIPVGPEGAVQSLKILEKRPDGTVDEEDALAVRFVPMTGGR